MPAHSGDRLRPADILARYLRDREPQREIEEGLNVVQAWNGANAVTCHGGSGKTSSSPRDKLNAFSRSLARTIDADQHG